MLVYLDNGTQNCVFIPQKRWPTDRSHQPRLPYRHIKFDPICIILFLDTPYIIKSTPLYKKRVIGKTQQIQTTNKIADSFPGMDGFVQAPAQQQSHVTVSVDPTKPPKWLRKPAGASFGVRHYCIKSTFFLNKLVCSLEGN